MADHAPLYLDLADAPDHGEAFWLKMRRRLVRAAVWKGGERGTVILFSGRTEYIEKYGRVIRKLTDRGFSVITLDWRGQGLSDRSLGDPMKGHVADFANYQIDVEALLATRQFQSLPKPRVLICHSMGGCIGMRSVLNRTIKPAAVIMSAPMLGIHMSRTTRTAAEVMVAMSRRFGFESAMAPAPKKDLAYVSWQPFEGNALTNDAEHYGWMKMHLEAEPGFGLGAPTLGWMGQAFDEMESLSIAPPLAQPTLMFLGDEEEVVEPPAIRRYDERAQTCRLVEITGAKHEVFMETSETRNIVWRETDEFLSRIGV